MICVYHGDDLLTGRFKSTSKSAFLVVFHNICVFMVVRPPIHIYDLNKTAIKITFLLYE